jgi:hypothetical protein
MARQTPQLSQLIYLSLDQPANICRAGISECLTGRQSLPVVLLCRCRVRSATSAASKSPNSGGWLTSQRWPLSFPKLSFLQSHDT